MQAASQEFNSKVVSQNWVFVLYGGWGGGGGGVGFDAVGERGRGKGNCMLSMSPLAN